MKPPRNLRERVFERALWAARLVVIVAVVAIVVLAFGAFYYALVDLTYLLGLLADYASLAPSERSAARDEGVTTMSSLWTDSSSVPCCSSSRSGSTSCSSAG